MAEFTVPSTAMYMKFDTPSTYGTTYNNNICVNRSNSAFNGKYFSHNNITFTELKSAGSVYDEIRDGKYIKRVGSVDLGTLTWANGSENT